MIFDPVYFVYVLPAMLLGLWAQYRVKSTYHAASRQPASMNGAQAAQHVLSQAGIRDVRIEAIPGTLSDHYDPRGKVLRLSQDVYSQQSMAAVGIAAHEAGHAIQDAKKYAPLVVRNAAVPIANIGSQAGLWMAFLGLAFQFQPLALIGIVLFAGVVAFQLVNLPVEFDASRRAKIELVDTGIVDQRDMVHVNRVLNAAALTYVAATLQAVMTLLYLLMRFNRNRN